MKALCTLPDASVPSLGNARAALVEVARPPGSDGVVSDTGFL